MNINIYFRQVLIYLQILILFGLYSCNPVLEAEETEPDIVKLESPIDIEITELTNSSFKIYWKSPDDIKFFKMDIALDSEFTQIFRDYYEKEIEGNFIHLSQLDHETMFHLRLKSTKGVFESQFTDVVSVVTLNFKEYLEAPLFETNIFNIKSDLFLEWEPVEGANLYSIDISEQEDFSGDFYEDFENKLIKDAFIEHSLEKNKVYYLRIKSVNRYITSEFTNTIKIVTSP